MEAPAAQAEPEFPEACPACGSDNLGFAGDGAATCWRCGWKAGTPDLLVPQEAVEGRPAERASPGAAPAPVAPLAPPAARQPRTASDPAAELWTMREAAMATLWTHGRRKAALKRARRWWWTKDWPSRELEGPVLAALRQEFEREDEARRQRWMAVLERPSP